MIDLIIHLTAYLIDDTNADAIAEALCLFLEMLPQKELCIDWLHVLWRFILLRERGDAWVLIIYWLNVTQFKKHVNHD